MKHGTKRFRVVATMTITVVVDVEAENREQAKARAIECGVMSLCHQCASGHDGEWSTTGELDGAPDEIVGVTELKG